MLGPSFVAMLRKHEEERAAEEKPTPAIDETKPAVIEARAALARATANRADISVGAYSFPSNGRHITSCADAEANLAAVLSDPSNHLPAAAAAAAAAADPAAAPEA
jgi:hypothetical protein